MQYVYVFLASLFWGGSFVATRYALTLGGLGLFSILAGRFLVSSSILIILTLLRGWEKLTLKELGKFLITALVFPGLYYFLETAGIARTSAVMASILIAVIPVLTAIIARIFLKEHLNLRGWIGVFISIGGIVMITLLADHRPGTAAISTLGILLTFGAAIMGASYITFTRHLMAHHKPLTLTTVQNVMGFIFFAPFAGAQITRWGLTVNLSGLLALGFLGVFASVGAFLAFNKALGTMEASKASLFLNIIPVVSLIFGWIILGEHLNGLQAVAGVVVIGGVLLASLKSKWDEAIPKKADPVRPLSSGTTEQK